jgi:uncharacterized protein YraI
MRYLLLMLLLLIATTSSRAAAQQEVVQVTAENVRLRAAASIEASILATLPKGAKLTVLGREGAWLQVRYADKSGFVRASLVSSGTPLPLPAPSAPVPTSPPAIRRENAPPTPPAPPQKEEARREPIQEERSSKKEPGTATLISVLVTGGGQIYAGDVTRGLMMLGGSFGAIVVGAALSHGPSCDSDFSCSSGSYAPLYLGALAGVGLWVYSIIDAAPTTRRMNARNGYRVSNLAPLFRPGPGGTTQIGLQVRF